MAGKDKQDDKGKTVEVTVPAKGMRAASAAPKAKNAGPLRGDNSFPASNKAMANNTQYSPGPAAEANAAAKAKKA